MGCVVAQEDEPLLPLLDSIKDWQCDGYDR
jgi:hypothetical protein